MDFDTYLKEQIIAFHIDFNSKIDIVFIFINITIFHFKFIKNNLVF